MNSFGSSAFRAFACLFLLVGTCQSQEINFGSQSSFSAGDTTSVLVADDFNGDSFPDVFTNSSALLLGCSGAFESTFGIYPVTSSDFAEGRTGNFNGDGFPDVAVVRGGVVSVLLSSVGGKKTKEISFIPASFFNLYGFSLAVADINNDGLDDFVATLSDGYGSRMQVMINNGIGETYSSIQSLIIFFEIQSVNLADFNGDGFQDMVLGGRSNSFFDASLGVSMGNPDGTFSEPVLYFPDVDPSYTTIADFNGDGFLDVVAANRATEDGGILLGVGDGTFIEGQTFEIGGVPIQVEHGDFDFDGYTDIVTVHEGSSTLRSASILRGLGDGTFEPEQRLEVTGKLAVADFNQDGRSDIAVSNSAAEEITVLWSGGLTVSAELGDINRDCRVDLLDVESFVQLLINGQFQVEADVNQDNSVDLLDIGPFVNILTGQ